MARVVPLEQSSPVLGKEIAERECRVQPSARFPIHSTYCCTRPPLVLIDARRLQHYLGHPSIRNAILRLYYITIDAVQVKRPLGEINGYQIQCHSMPPLIDHPSWSKRAILHPSLIRQCHHRDRHLRAFLSAFEVCSSRLTHLFLRMSVCR